ncbi:MAG: hypothetical protein V3S60_08100 [Acidimicrobiia bacterium]
MRTAPLSVAGYAGATFPKEGDWATVLRRLRSAFAPPPRSGGGWEGMVPNNGTLSEGLVRPEG